MFLPDSFLQMLLALGSAMNAPTRASWVTVVKGWLFAGRRTLTGVLVAAGAVGDKHHSAYYRVFATARWSLDALGLALFALARPLLEPGAVPLTLDDTLARKRGVKMFGTGMHHDPLASSRQCAVMSWGHCWVVLAVRVQLPCVPGRYFSLPLLFRLYLNRKAAARWHLAYRTKPQLAVELLKCLSKGEPERSFHVYADSAYGGQSVLAYLPERFDLTSRMPLDARLHAPVPERRRGTRGRPRKRGARLPGPEQMLEKQRARHLTLRLYGRQDKVRVVEGVAYWYSVPNRPLKIIVVEPLTGRRPVQAFYSTVTTETAEEVLQGYAGRWSIEEAFQGSKSHLGFEEPQGWSRLAARRTAPMAMLLYSLTVLWFAKEGHTHYEPPFRPWYRHKVRPSFADMLTTLRYACLRSALSTTPRDIQGQQKPLLLLPGSLQAAA
ncbi:MAG TPA: transposase [Archangium sp.]|nr:transposase [Archangium sp.]